jgi:hypothetical protein
MWSMSTRVVSMSMASFLELPRRQDPRKHSIRCQDFQALTLVEHHTIVIVPCDMAQARVSFGGPPGDS